MPVESYIVPTVIETTNRGERAFDIYSRMLKDRVIFITTPIDDTIAALITAQLLFLQSEDPERDIFLYINSPGGVVYSGLAIYDTMQHISPNVSTMCVGFCGSMATVILAGGAAGKRFVLPNGTVHMHPAGLQNLGGYAPDVEIHARELMRLHERNFDILANHTGQPVERIREDFARDRFFNAEQALEYGLIDEVITYEQMPMAAAGS
ncbi:MAG: ATP-dependent Clp protease proteolytic subunit [Chloroflexota bacterium]|nr:ATP-dependent Clp protease proteolytic subunit [Chloroflexota bacterium]